MPTLFITGSADCVISPDMLDDLYDASGAAVKEKFRRRRVADADAEGWNTVNDASDISLRGTKYDDSIVSSGSNVTINALGGNDSIDNGGDSVSIDGGAGADSIVNDGGWYSSISGGTGNDRISNSGNDVIMRVGSTTITIKDANKDDNILMLADDNYSATAALSEIVEPAQASYTPYDFEAGFDLVKQTSFTPAITFTDKK